MSARRTQLYDQFVGLRHSLGDAQRSFVYRASLTPGSNAFAARSIRVEIERQLFRADPVRLRVILPRPPKLDRDRRVAIANAHPSVSVAVKGRWAAVIKDMLADHQLGQGDRFGNATKLVTMW